MPGVLPRVPATLLALLAVLLLAGCGLQQDLANRGDVAGANPSTAPPITGPATDGGTIAPSLTQGHVVVLDFWASWCGPCRAEQADINALVKRYAARGVVFMGVDVRDDDASANSYRRDLGVTYRSLADPSGDIAAQFNVPAPPTTLVIDSSGHVVDRALGTLVGVSDALDKALG